MKPAAILIVLLWAVPLAAQEPTLSAANPLAALKGELERVLADAELPFTDQQERAITLMMEERRQASESLFGSLMDFRSGPTSVQEADRLQSAIEWMRQEFAVRIRQYLTEEQLGVWSEFETSSQLITRAEVQSGSRRPPAQTQYVRINNNSFTSESSGFQRNVQGGTEVIQRGGAGRWAGNAQFLMQDESLNARNAFAGNKPPYQERQISFEVGGPTIHGRLTSGFSASQNESENVDTVRATLPDGVFALGITRPTVNRNLATRQTVQLSDSHSLRSNLRYSTQTRTNQGVGGFNLPERAASSSGNSWNLDLRHFSSFSTGSIYETRVNANRNRSETLPVSEAVRINVLDAFNGGGAQNWSESRGGTYNFSNLYTRPGERLTTKIGGDAVYRSNHSLSTNNFGGTFTFSSLDTFLAGQPLTYRVTRGDPLREISQVEMSAYIQHDLSVNSQLTVMFGARYDAQTNLSDYNNISPRLGFAYGLGRAMIVRGGGGIFYDNLNMGVVETQRRLDGTRQFEIVIDNPSYPDAMAAGSIRQTFPAIRVTDPDLAAPYTSIGMISLERNLWRNMLATVMYDFQREVKRFRLRDLNAPIDSTALVLRACRPEQPADTCLRPDPTRGPIANLESTGNERSHNLRANVRQRFSIFNVSANYTLQYAVADDMGVQLPTDNYNLRGDRARAQNPRHSVSSTVNARLPLGVFLTGVMSANSGRYYTITTGRDDNRDSNINDRPPGVPRHSAAGPKYLNFNFNVSKAVFLSGSGGGARRNINLFANMSNAFNRVHYGTPSGVMTSPNFGRSTSASNPREIEIGVRLQF